MNKKKCPICGAEMKIDTSAVCMSIPPKFRCVCPSCNCLDFIKTSEYDQYKEEPSLPSNLDEAAQKVEDYYDVGEERGYLYCHRGDIKDAFKAGAEWMTAQWETIDGEITTTSDNGWEIIRIPKKLYPLGTKVTVQIRKK